MQNHPSVPPLHVFSDHFKFLRSQWFLTNTPAVFPRYTHAVFPAARVSVRSAFIGVPVGNSHTHPSEAKPQTRAQHRTTQHLLSAWAWGKDSHKPLLLFYCALKSRAAQEQPAASNRTTNQQTTGKALKQGSVSSADLQDWTAVKWDGSKRFCLLGVFCHLQPLQTGQNRPLIQHGPLHWGQRSKVKRLCRATGFSVWGQAAYQRADRMWDREDVTLKHLFTNKYKDTSK